MLDSEETIVHSAGARNWSIWSLVKERRPVVPVGVKKEISRRFSKPSNPIGETVDDMVFVVKRGNGEEERMREWEIRVAI